LVPQVREEAASEVESAVEEEAAGATTMVMVVAVAMAVVEAMKAEADMRAEVATKEEEAATTAAVAVAISTMRVADTAGAVATEADTTTKETGSMVSLLVLHQLVVRESITTNFTEVVEEAIKREVAMAKISNGNTKSLKVRKKVNEL
jgi:hypothetical protein